jgi:hypothetical protein
MDDLVTVIRQERTRKLQSTATMVVFYRFARLQASSEQTLHSTQQNSTLRTYKPKKPLQIKIYTTIHIHLKFVHSQP